MQQKQIEDCIWLATMHILGYDPDDADMQDKVRISWPTDEMGSPDWSRTDITVFIRVSQLLDNYSALWDIEHVPTDDGLRENVSNHEAFEVSWIIYGTDALETAQKLRYGLLRENIRRELDAAGMAFKTEIRMPAHMPEQDRTGDWWNRYDLNAQLYLKQTRGYSEEWIGKAPDITVSYVEYEGFILDDSEVDVGRLGIVTVSQTA